MSELKNSRAADQIAADIDKEDQIMMIHEKNGNYVDAETSRRRLQQLRQDLQNRMIYEMEVRHRQETQDMQKAQENQLATFNNMWSKKLSDIATDGAKNEKDLTTRHQADLENTKKQLENHHPLKVKESSECLNLRKMEEHMAKQKNFVEAHRVQAALAEMEKAEKQAWIDSRNNKIETALNNLKAKQAIELANLQKRIRTLLDEQNRDRIIEEQRLRQKYLNIQNELKSQHDKETLAHLGQFKSKGGSTSPMKTTRSVLVK